MSPLSLRPITRVSILSQEVAAMFLDSAKGIASLLVYEYLIAPNMFYANEKTSSITILQLNFLLLEEDNLAASYYHF